MKKLTTGLVACALALAMVSSVTAQSVVQGKARVVRIGGHARFTTGNNVWQPLHVGDVIKPGTVVQTENKEGAFVDLVLGDGSGSLGVASSGGGGASSAAVSPIAYRPSAEQNVVRIWQNSALGIDKLSSTDTGADVVTETQLDLRAGRVLGTVKKMNSASKYEIKLPNGVAGIRGTFYDITSDGVVRVTSGSVVLAYMAADGTVTTKVVVAGQQFDARTGEVTPIPEDVMRSMDTVERMLLSLGTPGEKPTEFVHDHTIYHVSPFRGHHGHGHGPPGQTDSGDGQ
jgi:FecR protein